MDISHTEVIERIARVLAGRRLSINGSGSHASAAIEVDHAWRDFRDDAIAVLRTLREPDAIMARAGDAAIWEKMVLAALGECEGAHAAPEPFDPPPAGTDPFHEGP